jgi:hypothetical protein
MLQVLETTLVGALTGSATAVYFVIIGLAGYSQVLTAIGQIIPLVGAVIALRIAGDAIAVARLVNVPSSLQAARGPNDDRAFRGTASAGTAPQASRDAPVSGSSGSSEDQN